MEALATTVKTNGSVYKLLRRSDTTAIYKQFIEGTLVGYEVFKIPVRPAEHITGKEYPQRETYPNGSMFGKTAWSYGTRYSEKEVLRIFENLEDKIKEYEV